MMDEHEDDFADEYRKWAEENTGDNGIGYPKPVFGGSHALWREFQTDYGTKHVDEILEKYGE